eukprot:7344681-Prymnesium_polylepis.1
MRLTASSSRPAPSRTRACSMPPSCGGSAGRTCRRQPTGRSTPGSPPGCIGRDCRASSRRWSQTRTR